MFSRSMSMNTVKSPKSPKNRNRSFKDNISSSKNVCSSNKKKCLRTSTPLKNVDSTQDSKTNATNSSPESSQLEQKESKFMLNLLKKLDTDNIDLNSQDERLILKIANKNKKRILSLNTSQINTQEFIELNADLATRNLLPSCTQLDTSSKEMVKSIDSDDVTVVTSSESDKVKDFKTGSANKKTLEKTKNSKYCTIDIDQESETLKKTQDSETSKQDQDRSSKEMVKTIDLNDISVVTSSGFNRIKVSKSDNTIGKTFDKTKNSKFCTINLDQESGTLKETQDSKSLKQNLQDTSSKEIVKTIDLNDVTVVTSFESDGLKDSKSDDKLGKTFNKTKNSKCCMIDLEQETKSSKDTKKSESSKQDHKLSKQEQDSEIIAFQSMCEEMLKIKLLKYNTDNIKINNRVIYFKQVNDDIISCIGYAPSTNNDISRKGCRLKRKISNSSAISSENSDVPLQTEYAKQNKRSKLNLSYEALKTRPKWNLNKPVSNIIDYFVVTSSEDEGDSVSINNKMAVCTRKKSIDDSAKANKRLKEVKPIFKCTPNGQIHKDMLNLIHKKIG